MRFALLTIIYLFVLQTIGAQTNAYECTAYTNHVTQAQLNAYRDHFGACILLGESRPINVSGNAERIIYSSNQIQLKENFYAGSFSSSGEMRLTVSEPELDVVVMNYSSLNQILKYKKFELGVALPSDILTRVNNFLLNEGTDSTELNPFVEWDIDVEATFFHPATGIYKKIDGYYHREYNQNPVTNDWDDVGTNYPFRIRYAPPQNGKWVVTITIKVNQQLVSNSKWIGFNVIESGDPGYVQVFPNKKNLKRGNTMIFPVGHNFFEPDRDQGIGWGGGNTLGNNLFPLQNTKASNTLTWNHYLSKVESYFQSGGKYIRTLQAPWISLIEFEKKGNYYDRLHYAWEQDKLLDLCEQYDALMMFNLLIHHPLEIIAGFDLTNWDWGREEKHWQTGEYFINEERPVFCYNDTPNKKPHETFLLENDLKYHEQRTRYYIARYGYSTKIYEFELLSEPFNIEKNSKEGFEPYSQAQTSYRQTIFNAIENYQGRLANFIKISMGHTEHLLGVNYTVNVWKPTIGTTMMDGSAFHPSIDIVGINDYSNAPHKYIISKGGDNIFFYPDENSRARAIINYFRMSTGKPVIISELGDGDNTQKCSNYSGSYIDIMSGGFSGVCGYNLWAGTESTENFLWPATIRAQNHMNGSDVITTLSNVSGNWTQGRQAEKIYNHHGLEAKELQYYVSNNKEIAVGYVRNRTYNFYTKRINEECNVYTWTPANNHVEIRNIFSKYPFFSLFDFAWDDGNNELKLQGLKSNTNYQIDWYSFKDGWYLGSDCRNTSFFVPELTLRFPKLFVTPGEVERPMVWFVAKQNNCMVGMMPVEGGAEAFLLEEYNESNMVLNIDEHSNQDSPAIYPNPFDDYFTVESLQDDVLVIQEINGKIVHEEKINKGSTTINTQNLSMGVYIIKLINQNIQTKLVKK
jgi:hypothetical protein